MQSGCFSRVNRRTFFDRFPGHEVNSWVTRMCGGFLVEVAGFVQNVALREV